MCASPLHPPRYRLSASAPARTNFSRRWTANPSVIDFPSTAVPQASRVAGASSLRFWLIAERNPRLPADLPNPADDQGRAAWVTQPNAGWLKKISYKSATARTRNTNAVGGISVEPPRFGARAGRSAIGAPLSLQFIPPNDSFPPRADQSVRLRGPRYEPRLSPWLSPMLWSRPWAAPLSKGGCDRFLVSSMTGPRRQGRSRPSGCEPRRSEVRRQRGRHRRAEAGGLRERRLVSICGPLRRHERFH